MSTNDAAARSIDDLLPKGRTIAMLMTMIGPEHSSRPLTVVEAAGDRLAFLVDGTVPWVQAVAEGSASTHVTVADEKENLYLSLQGMARVTTNDDERRRLWTSMASVWFDGPEDPRLAVLHFHVTGGEYWDGPSGALGRAISMVRGKATGDEGALGDKGPVATAPLA